MNTASKAFGLSLAFHSLIALFALLMLNIFHTPVKLLALPLNHLTLVSLSRTSEILTPHSSPPTHTETAKIIPKTVPKESSVAPTRISPDLQKREAMQTPPSIAAPNPLPATIVSKPSPDAVATPAQSPIKAQPKANISAEKQSFFAHLRTKIQQNLRYPSSARRRGMEGEVSVQFVLENSGAIRDITIRNGDGIFHESAKLAVASASGVKIPEVLSDTFPTDVKLTLEFRLD